MLEIAYERVQLYRSAKGNYSSWQLNKDRQNQIEIAEYEKLQRDIKRLKEAAKQKSRWSDSVEATKIVVDLVIEDLSVIKQRR